MQYSSQQQQFGMQMMGPGGVIHYVPVQQPYHHPVTPMTGVPYMVLQQPQSQICFSNQINGHKASQVVTPIASVPSTPVTPSDVSTPTAATPKTAAQVTAEINGARVPFVCEKPEDEVNAAKILDMKAFKEWSVQVDKDFLIKRIIIQSIDMFGPRVGFVKFKADVSDRDGTAIPSIVFMRGAAVAMLIVIDGEDGKQYTVLTVQPRFPTGKYAFPDLPAGMLDASGDFSGVAAKELKEETGIVVGKKDLVDMTELAFGNRYLGVYPSCGGCDEFLRYFLYRTKMSQSQIQELQGKCTGLLEEGEKIKLKVILLEELWNAAPDGKALTALSLYDNLLRQNKLA